MQGPKGRGQHRIKFISGALEMVKVPPLPKPPKNQQNLNALQPFAPKPPRELPPRDDAPPLSDLNPGRICVEVWGDNELVCDWVNGKAGLDKSSEMTGMVKTVQNGWWSLWSLARAVPRHDDWTSHHFREYNKEADALAGIASESGLAWHDYAPLVDPCVALRGMCDGSHNHNRTAIGWRLEALEEGQRVWTHLASSARCISTSSAVIGELTANMELSVAIASFILVGRTEWNSKGEVLDLSVPFRSAVRACPA